MCQLLLALGGLLSVASVIYGMPPLPPPMPPSPPHPEAFFGAGMKRSGGAAMPAAPPLPPPRPSKRVPAALADLRTSDTTIDHEAIVNDWQNINIPLGNVDTIKNDLPGEPLSPADFENAVTINLPQYEAGGQKVDPIELAALFEGDILVMNKSDLAHLGPRNGRNAMIDNNKRWSNGVVPYVISSSYNKQERATIAIAMKSYHEKTCLRFVPRTIERDYIHILKGDGCSSSVGRVGGAQAVSLGLGCLYAGIVMHELMHAVGFWHEQSREDRDRYITINWLNIQGGMDFNFKKFTWGTIQGLGVEYDTSSIMHYGPYAFAKDRSKPTIIPHKTGVEIGQRRAFSKTDIRKLNIFYECSGVDNSGGGGNSIVKPNPVKPPKPNGCSDNNQYCGQWSDAGECEANHAWMNINCKKSCNQCGTPCKDQSEHCDYWKNNGECTKNSEYMTLFCKHSCGACHGKDDHLAVCANHNKHCETWAKMSQCRSNPNYMLLYCNKACQQCQ
ncbi:unnamed protein product, partial [Meganyctiphanes norvegica]